MANAETTAVFPLRDHDLAATLGSGQAFRWREIGDGWEGVVAGRWVRLTVRDGTLEARTALPCTDWSWLTGYLRLDEDLPAVIATFPDDAPMRAAVSACPGLRLLRQEPWECLASFILSSTKQIVQIQQCVALLSHRFGDPVASGGPEACHAFPSFARLASATEAELRTCKLGFRAKYLLGTARMLAAGEIGLDALHSLSTEDARAALIRFPGVGRKIADCVLLFAYGRQDAFPVDVWVLKALRFLYFPRRAPKPDRLRRFTGSHFGPNAGYAQQYLFHYVRTKVPELRSRTKKP